MQVDATGPRKRFGSSVSAGLHALFGEARERARRRRRRQSLLVVALCAIAAFAGLAINDGSSAPRPPALPHQGLLHIRDLASGESLDPLGAVPTLHQLMDNFAILRRSQTTLDRSWEPQCGCGGAARQLSNLTRMATKLPDGDRVFLDVEQFILGAQLNMAAGSYVLNLDIVNRDGNTDSEAFGPNVHYSVIPLSSGNLFVSVVPDGVSSVSWKFDGCQPGEEDTARCAGPHRHTFTVPVVNNVAAQELPPCRTCGQVSQVAWRSSDGHVVASFGGFGNLPAAPFVAGKLGSGTRHILGPAGIGGARLGESASQALQIITQSLGPPADANVPTASCGIGHETVWTSPAVADPLTAYERAGRFVGYQYGAPISEIGLERGPGAVLASQRGLTISDSIRVARRFYATGFSTSAAPGVGRWNASLNGGELYGYVLPTIYPLRVVTDRNPVATIDAGNTGCQP